DPGQPGSPGPMGLTGSKGDRGEAGEMGPRGVPGQPGQEGPPGRDGVSCTAEDVLEGIMIICGDVSVLIRHGEQGSQGERGEQGPAGQDGEHGVAGAQGEAGPVGPQGLEGQRGPQGDQGIPGDNLHLFDASGQDLGIFISVGRYRSYLPNLDVLAEFEESGNIEIGIHVRLFTDQKVWFGGPNCTGQMFVESTDMSDSWRLQGIHSANPDVYGYSRVVPGSRSVDLVVSSRQGQTVEEVCVISAPRNLHLYPLETIELPFREPLTWPLKVGIIQ
ncbi:MAG: hypothetical protein Q7S89_02235, partial [bacterium]|nr:hypothetical protein [bacterium]